MHKQIRITYKGEKQLPEVMIIEEFYDNGKIVHANAIYVSDVYIEIVFDQQPNFTSEHRIKKLP